MCRATMGCIQSGTEKNNGEYAQRWPQAFAPERLSFVAADCCVVRCRRLSGAWFVFFRCSEPRRDNRDMHSGSRPARSQEKPINKPTQSSPSQSTPRAIPSSVKSQYAHVCVPPWCFLCSHARAFYSPANADEDRLGKSIERRQREHAVMAMIVAQAGECVAATQLASGVRPSHPFCARGVVVDWWIGGCLRQNGAEPSSTCASLR